MIKNFMLRFIKIGFGFFIVLTFFVLASIGIDYFYDFSVTHIDVGLIRIFYFTVIVISFFGTGLSFLDEKMEK